MNACANQSGLCVACRIRARLKPPSSCQGIVVAEEPVGDARRDSPVNAVSGVGEIHARGVTANGSRGNRRHPSPLHGISQGPRDKTGPVRSNRRASGPLDRVRSWKGISRGQGGHIVAEGIAKQGETVNTAKRGKLGHASANGIGGSVRAVIDVSKNIVRVKRRPANRRGLARAASRGDRGLARGRVARAQSRALAGAFGGRIAGAFGGRIARPLGRRVARPFRW